MDGYDSSDDGGSDSDGCDESGGDTLLITVVSDGDGVRRCVSSTLSVT